MTGAAMTHLSRQTASVDPRARAAHSAIRLLVVSLAACSALPDEEASSHPTLSSTPVPPEATVCGVVSAAHLSEVLVQGVGSYYYSNIAWSSDFIVYDCVIRLGEGPYEQVRAHYLPARSDVDGYLIPPVTRPAPLPRHISYDDVAATDSARPMVLDGVEGEGVTVQDTGGYAGAFAWRYPDGSVLSVGIMARKMDAREDPDDVARAIELARDFVPAIPDLATAGDSNSEWNPIEGTQYINGYPVTELNTTPTPTQIPAPTDTGTP